MLSSSGTTPTPPRASGHGDHVGVALVRGVRNYALIVAFPKSLLQENEELVLDLRPHWWFIAPAGAVLVLAVVVGLVAVASGIGAFQVVAALALLAALGWFGARYARWATTNFAVTSERIVFRQGLLSRRATQMPLEKINTVDFAQTLFERLIGGGDLIIESGSDSGRALFSDIRKPLAVQQEINRQMDRHEKGSWGAPGGGGAFSNAAPGSIPQQIAQLAELRDQGVLSEEEFQAKKAQLLDRL